MGSSFFRFARPIFIVLMCQCIPAVRAQTAAPGIAVINATWGLGNKTLDVTQKLQNLIDSGQSATDFSVSNQTLGEPVKGQKNLTLTFTVNGQTHTRIYKGGDTLNLAALAAQPEATVVAPNIAPKAAIVPVITAERTAPIAKAVAPADPFLWKPAVPKALESAMPEKEYQKRKDEILAAFDKKTLDDAAAPIAGIHINRVKADLTAAAAGLKEDDIIVEIDGKKSVSSRDLANIAFMGRDYPVTVYSPKTGTHTVTLSAVDPGIQGEPWIAMERYYWRKGPRGAQWDDDMLVASLACRNEPELAMAALKHAEAAGCDAGMVMLVRALAAGMADHHEEALEIGLPLVKQAPAEIRPYMLWLLGEAAIASYHLPLIPDTTVFSDDEKDQIKLEIKFHQALPDAVRISRPPFIEATLRKTRDYSAALEDTPPSSDFEPPSIPNAEWLARKKLLLDVPTGRRHMLEFGPLLKDFVYSADFAMISSDPENSTWRDVTTMQLTHYNADQQLYTGEVAGRLDVLSNGKVRVTHVSMAQTIFPDFITQRAWFADHKKHMLSIGLVGQRFEFSVDGTPVYDGPFEENRNFMGQFIVSGMKTNLLGLEWREVMPAQ